MASSKTDKKVSRKIDPAKSVDQLRTELTATRMQLLDQRRSNAAGELTNPHAITKTRKLIARLLTAIKLAQTKQEETTK